EPGFAHLGSDDLPIVEAEGKHVRLIAGALFGARSPLATTSDTIFADVSLAAGATMPLDADYEERGVYVVKGEIDIAGDTFAEGRLLVFRPGDRITLKAITAARRSTASASSGGISSPRARSASTRRARSGSRAASARSRATRSSSSRRRR